MLTVERLVERLDDKIAADERCAIELEAIAVELHGIRLALEMFARATVRMAGVFDRADQ